MYITTFTYRQYSYESQFNHHIYIYIYGARVDEIILPSEITRDIIADILGENFNIEEFEIIKQGLRMHEAKLSMCTNYMSAFLQS